MIRNAIIISPEDNIATVLRDIQEGETVVAGNGDQTLELPAKQNIAFGHKVSVCNIAEGDHILKYGAVIGAASAAISKGEHVHVHNVVSLRGRGDLSVNEEKSA